MSVSSFLLVTSRASWWKEGLMAGEFLAEGAYYAVPGILREPHFLFAVFQMPRAQGEQCPKGGTF